MIDLTHIESEIGEHIYYIVEQDCFWIGFFNIGNFIQEHSGFYYFYVGQL